MRDSNRLRTVFALPQQAQRALVIVEGIAQVGIARNRSLRNHAFSRPDNRRAKNGASPDRRRKGSKSREKRTGFHGTEQTFRQSSCGGYGDSGYRRGRASFRLHWLCRRVSRCPLPAVAAIPGRNARLIGIIFRQCHLRSRDIEQLHHGVRRHTLIEKTFRQEQPIGICSIIEPWQARKGQSYVRQRFVALLPKTRGAFQMNKQIRGRRSTISGGKKGEKTKLVAVEQKSLPG
ncbi:hypothetical protein [Rhodoblastus sp.]|jgi:hypothetical protein|uniref:hypothetical protein n=1 Tax=Rhodoblastus sp. TaxID=1962975 RepID=UPI0025F42648|nr:hypothetical protein [Rhodoblastus sp.]